jgi:hypothetical protein
MSTKVTVEEIVAEYPGLLDWLLHGEKGISSKTIVSVVTGHVLDGYQSEPYDPADFRRCELLLRAVPLLRLRLDRMRFSSSWWSYLVENWDEIVATAEEEVPGCFGAVRSSGSAPRTYALIKAGRKVPA